MPRQLASICYQLLKSKCFWENNLRRSVLKWPRKGSVCGVKMSNWRKKGMWISRPQDWFLKTSQSMKLWTPQRTCQIICQNHNFPKSLQLKSSKKGPHTTIYTAFLLSAKNNGKLLQSNARISFQQQPEGLLLTEILCPGTVRPINFPTSKIWCLPSKTRLYWAKVYVRNAENRSKR